MASYYRSKKPRRGSRRASSRRALSTKRIYSRTSAKAQATQIYALRKRISSMEKRLRPDVKVLSGTPRLTTFTSGALSTIWDGVGVLQPSVGAANNQRVGDKIWEKALNIQFYAEYFNNSDTGYHSSESSGCSVRIFVVQHKSKGDPTSSVYTLNTFLDNPDTTGANYNILAVKPFAENVTQDWKILYNTAFTMTSARNQKIMSIQLKPGLIRFDGSGNHNFLKVYTVVSGLHTDANFVETVKTTVNVKLVYTDI